MRSLVAIGLVALLILSGCSGKSDKDKGNVDPSTYTDADKFDSAVGNEGFQVTGSLTGAASALDATSAAQLEIVDNSPNDAAGAADKASLLLDAKAAGITVAATLRSMVTATQGGVAGAEFHGGVAQNIPIDATTGLPPTKAFLLLYGLARLSVNGNLATHSQLVVAAATYGVRDATGAVAAAEDTHDLELHVLFPGSLIAGNPAVAGVPDGFLYFYFENVAITKLTADKKAEVGKDLVPPEQPNKPPSLNARVLVAGAQADKGTKEGNKTLNVTFDASASTDADGTIEFTSWDVFWFNNTGKYEPSNPKRVGGSKAFYEFPKAGVYQILVKISDDAGAIVNSSLTFYVDHHSVMPYDSQLQPAGAGTDCQDVVNCNRHAPQVSKGITKAVFKFVNKATTPPQNIHLDLYKPAPPACTDPGAAPIAKTTPPADTLTVTGDKLTVAGAYQLCVWFEAGAQAKWDIDSMLSYSPVTG